MFSKAAITGVCFANLLAWCAFTAFAFGQVTVNPELPRVYLDTTFVAQAGNTVAVPAGGDFQAALNAAQPGDTITLAAGATFSGNFTLPNKSGIGWIVIRTSAPDGYLPPPGSRITPDYAGVLPKVVSPNGNPAIATLEGAHHYRLIGIEVTLGAGVTSHLATGGLLQLGDWPAQTTIHPWTLDHPPAPGHRLKQRLHGNHRLPHLGRAPPDV